MKDKRVMVFGVFDGLHPGHRAFLQQAKSYGHKLIVVVARDSAVRKLKHKNPRQNERQRVKYVRRVNGVSQATFGDDAEGSYGVIRRFRPDVICLGYDQQRLEKDLRMRMRRRLIPGIRIIHLKPHHPDKFKSSKISYP